LPVWFLYAAGGALVLWLLGKKQPDQVTPLDQRQSLGPPAGDPALTQPRPTSVEPVGPPGPLTPIVAPSSPPPPATPVPPVCPRIDLGRWDPAQAGLFLESQWDPVTQQCWPRDPVTAPVAPTPPPPPLQTPPPPPPAPPLAVVTGQLAAKAAVTARSSPPSTPAVTIMKPVDPPPVTRTDAVLAGLGPSLSQAFPGAKPLPVYRPTGVGTTTPPTTVPPNTVPPPALVDVGSKAGRTGGRAGF
jgi:hypothetical protein